jgi:hypothetical protein
MDPNFKPLHERAYIVPISAEQKLQQCKEMIRLVDIGVLEVEYSCELASIFLPFAIPKKNRKKELSLRIQHGTN